MAKDNKESKLERAKWGAKQGGMKSKFLVGVFIVLLQLCILVYIVICDDVWFRPFTVPISNVIEFKIGLFGSSAFSHCDGHHRVPYLVDKAIGHVHKHTLETIMDPIDSSASPNEYMCRFFVNFINSRSLSQLLTDLQGITLSIAMGTDVSSFVREIQYQRGFFVVMVILTVAADILCALMLIIWIVMYRVNLVRLSILSTEGLSFILCIMMATTYLITCPMYQSDQLLSVHHEPEHAYGVGGVFIVMSAIVHLFGLVVLMVSTVKRSECINAEGGNMKAAHKLVRKQEELRLLEAQEVFGDELGRKQFMAEHAEVLRQVKKERDLERLTN